MLIEPQRFEDSRGFFMERYQLDRFAGIGLPAFLQDNFSRSAERVLRGLHFQYKPAQGKLVTCLRGKVFDVAVDIRRESSTFGRHVPVILDGDHPQWFWIPAGFAHGFQVISSCGADIWYKVDAKYSAEFESGLLWNDRDLDIRWPLEDAILSERDQIQCSWTEYVQDPFF